MDFKAGDVVKYRYDIDNIERVVRTDNGNNIYFVDGSAGISDYYQLIRSAPKFKAGDKVRYTNPNNSRTVRVVSRMTGNAVHYVTGGFDYDDILELVPGNPSIVARLKNGAYQPNANPRIHPDSESAVKEASRLAEANPGVEFATFTLTHKTVSAEVLKTVKTAGPAVTSKVV